MYMYVFKFGFLYKMTTTSNNFKVIRSLIKNNNIIIIYSALFLISPVIGEIKNIDVPNHSGLYYIIIIYLLLLQMHFCCR